MIKNLLYIEDGSVDIDALEEILNSETRIIVYRQGSTPPLLVQPLQPINDIYEEAGKDAQQRLKNLENGVTELLYEVLKEKSLTKRAQKLIDKFGADNLWG